MERRGSASAGRDRGVEESELVAGLKAGDGAAFETLVRLHAPRLLSVTRRLLRNEDDAREALQEAFVNASRAVQEFDGASRLSTWLHRIAVNCALMKLRSRKRSPEQSIENFLPRFKADGHEVRPTEKWAENAASAAETKEARALVLESIDRLPESYRTVLVLRDIEEIDTKGVASLLGIEENAAKVRLHRARQALRALLHPHFRSAEPASPS